MVHHHGPLLPRLISSLPLSDRAPADRPLSPRRPSGPAGGLQRVALRPVLPREHGVIWRPSPGGGRARPPFATPEGPAAGQWSGAQASHAADPLHGRGGAPR
jgi:hypothetical protein